MTKKEKLDDKVVEFIPIKVSLTCVRGLYLELSYKYIDLL